MSKSVLVSGANGFIGRHLCAGLRRDGHRVIALLRTPPCGDGQAVDVPWDEWRLADFERYPPDDIADGAEVVCHLAALVQARGVDESRYQRVNVEGTHHLLAAATRAGARGFIHFSSIKAAGETSRGCVDESAPARPETAYGRSKLEAERAVHAADALDWRVNLRLSPVYGERMAGSLRQLSHAVRAGWLPPLPAIENRRSFVHVADVVRVVSCLVGTPVLGKKTYYVSDGHAYSTGYIVSLIRRSLGRPLSRWHSPLLLWRALALGGDLAGRLLRRPMPFDGNRYRAMFADACYCNHLLRAETGFDPACNLDAFFCDGRETDA